MGAPAIGRFGERKQSNIRFFLTRSTSHGRVRFAALLLRSVLVDLDWATGGSGGNSSLPARRRQRGLVIPNLFAELEAHNQEDSGAILNQLVFLVPKLYVKIYMTILASAGTRLRAGIILRTVCDVIRMT